MSNLIEIEDGAIATVSKKGPDEARTARKANALVALAESMEVKTQADYDLAAGELRTIVAFHGELEAERTGFTGPLNLLLDKMNARFQPYLKALRGDGKKGSVSAESIIKGKMSAFLAEQERLAAEERRKAEALAQAERDRLAAEAERVRKEAEAEAERLAQIERDRVAEAERQQKLVDDAAALVKNKAARARAEEAAALLRKQNEEAAAEAARQADVARELAERQAAALETTAAVTIAQPVTVVVSKGRGISTPKTIDWELQDLLMLATFIVNKRPDLIYLLAVEDKKMGMQVKLQGLATQIDGVRVFERVGITVR